MLRVHENEFTNRPAGGSVRSGRRSSATQRVLSAKQMESRFPSQWILVADPVVDKHLRVLKGRVVAHGKDRDEIGQRALEMRLKRAAFLYTGKPPQAVEFVL